MGEYARENWRIKANVEARGVATCDVSERVDRIGVEISAIGKSGKKDNKNEMMSGESLYLFNAALVPFIISVKKIKSLGTDFFQCEVLARADVAADVGVAYVASRCAYQGPDFVAVGGGEFCAGKKLQGFDGVGKAMAFSGEACRAARGVVFADEVYQYPVGYKELKNAGRRLARNGALIGPVKIFCGGKSYAPGAIHYLAVVNFIDINEI